MGRDSPEKTGICQGGKAGGNRHPESIGWQTVYSIILIRLVRIVQQRQPSSGAAENLIRGMRSSRSRTPAG